LSDPFPSPLIERSMRISRTTLSDWFHRGHTTADHMSVYHAPVHLGVATQPARKVPGFIVVCRLMPIHRPSPPSTSTPEVRVLSSAGVTRHQRWYDPVRPPSAPSPCGDVEEGSYPRAKRTSPNYAIHLSNMPCPIPRWTKAGARVGCFPTPLGPSPFLRWVAAAEWRSQPSRIRAFTRNVKLLAVLIDNHNGHERG
jgi:hypothetical protein